MTMKDGKAFSDADRKMMKKMLSGDPRILSDGDRKMMKKMLKGGSGTFSDGDRKMMKKMLRGAARRGAAVSAATAVGGVRSAADELFIKRNDGGIARKTRTF